MTKRERQRQTVDRVWLNRVTKKRDAALPDRQPVQGIRPPKNQQVRPEVTR